MLYKSLVVYQHKNTNSFKLWPAEKTFPVEDSNTQRESLTSLTILKVV